MRKLSIVKWMTFCLAAHQVTLFSENYTKQLSEYLDRQGYKAIEGNCCAGETTQPLFIQNLLQQHPHIQSIGEIGFNAGHSSLIFLEYSPHATVYSFDLGIHPYVDMGKAFVDSLFPQRHNLIKGNSLKTLKAFASHHCNIKFDLVFIDGGHSFEEAYHDIIAMKKLSHPGTLVLIDDLSIPGVKKAFDQCVKENLILPGPIERSKHKAWSVCTYNFEV